MNMKVTTVAVFCLALSLSNSGCTSNRPFRTNFRSTDPNDPHAVIEAKPEYKVGFVELDDQGGFWDLRQRAAVRDMILAEAGLDRAPGRQPQGVVLVAFVHGWKDSAAFDSGGVVAFREILKELDKAEQAQTAKHPPRKVVGVYIGWRGLSATWEPFKELSFWDRKETAHKVGGYGAMTDLLVELENIQKDSHKSLSRTELPRTELIIIGHSFGGAAVYSALSQIVIERFANSVERDKGARLKPLGDQIILLNPAFEALRHFDLNEMALAVRKYPSNQRPVLSIFTSQGDWATHYAFPTGRFFSTLFENNRDGRQKAAGRESVGWFGPFVTHTLDYKAGASAASSQPATPNPSTLNPRTGQHEYHDRATMEQSVNQVEDQRNKWRPNSATPQTYYFDDCVLNPKKSFRPGDPFLIVSVDPQIMSGHNDISNHVLINFIRQYIQFCQTDPSDRSE